MRAKEFLRNASGTVALRFLFLTAVMLALSPAMAQAGFITIDPAGMDAIFSQSSFGATPIDIRFNPPQLIADPALLEINNAADEAALVNLAPDPAPRWTRSLSIKSTTAISRTSRSSTAWSMAARNCRAMSLSRSRTPPHFPPRP